MAESVHREDSTNIADREVRVGKVDRAGKTDITEQITNNLQSRQTGQSS